MTEQPANKNQGNGLAARVSTWQQSRRERRSGQSTATRLIAGIALLLPILGVLALLCYTGFTKAFGIGALAALSAAVVGLLFGLLFGVPRVVSSGEFRLAGSRSQNPGDSETQTGVEHPEEGGKAAQAGGGQADTSVSTVAPARYGPSTNLAEVSDWLTKLLLGAGLVSLTRLGAPLGHLIDSLAAGMSGTPDGPSKVAAGAILFGYAAMGFLDGYILTTVWYQNVLQSSGDQGHEAKST